MGLKTPVAFMVFNRPDTTRQVFAAIRQVQPETLLLVADGPRLDRPDEVDLCTATRAIIAGVDWPCEVMTNFADTNMGCKLRVSSGLDWVFRQVEEAIILEDDCLPHQSFFRFCEEMLALYRNDERIMMIGGINYLLDQLAVDDSYFFSRYYAIWGWASWRRAWQHYDIAMHDWPAHKAERHLESFYSEKYMQRYVARMFDDVSANRISTWDIQWFYSCLFNNSLCIVPKVNLVTNIGVFGTHASGYVEHITYPIFALDTDMLRHPRQVFPNTEYERQFFGRYFRLTLVKLWKNVVVYLKKRGVIPV